MNKQRAAIAKQESLLRAQRFHNAMNRRWAFRGGAMFGIGATLIYSGYIQTGLLAVAAGFLLAKPARFKTPAEEFWGA